MTNKHNDKKENEDIKVDEIILQAEKDGREEKNQLVKESASLGSADSIKKIGNNVNLVLVFVLLLISIIQSVELFNLRAQILEGQFSAPASAAPATGGDQGLPSQQGGC